MDLQEELKLRLQCFFRQIGLGKLPIQAAIAVVLLCVLVVGFGVWRFWPSSTTEGSSDFEVILTEAAEAADNNEDDSLVATSEEDSGTDSIVVDVEGAVEDPGVYELNAGSRVQDALTAAGGLTESAESSVINRALALEDGAAIYVPTAKEVSSGQYEDLLASGLISSFGSTVADGGTSVSRSTSASTGVSSDGLVNINTATAAELQTLSGIGEVLASQIIAYRESNGAFSSISDIQNVSGIGEARYAAIKDSICV